MDKALPGIDDGSRTNPDYSLAPSLPSSFLSLAPDSPWLPTPLLLRTHAHLPPL